MTDNLSKHERDLLFISTRLEHDVIPVKLELSMASIAVSLKRIADTMQAQQTTTPPGVYGVQTELHILAKEVNALARHHNPMHPQVF